MSCEFCSPSGNCGPCDNTIRPFGRLGSSISDLLTKGYNFRHNSSVRKIAKNGVGIESGVLKSVGDGMDGFIKADYSFPQLNVHGRVETTGEAQGGLRFHKGAHALALTTSLWGAKWQQATGTVLAETTNPGYDAALIVNVDPSNKKLALAPEVGAAIKLLDTGVTVGLNAKVESTGRGNALAPDVNAGVEYTHGLATATVTTSDKFQGVTTSVFVKAANDLDVGASVEIAPQNHRLVTTGLEYRLDRDTTVKAKVDSNRNITAAIEHRLFNPLVRFGVCSSFDLNKGKLATNRFGIGLSFGDYTA